MTRSAFIIFLQCVPVASAAGLKFARHGSSNANRNSNCNKGDTICTRNSASVVQEMTPDGKWMRRLVFGDECATESAIVCKNKHACPNICEEDCPCDVDISVGLAAHYMQTMFELLSQQCSQNSRVLMLGLGGGELSQYLLHKCPGMNIDAVELNSDVIALAKSYFGVRESELEFAGRLTVEQNDAFSAVGARAAGRDPGYDAVLVDCFTGGGEVPESCRSREFAKNVKAILKPSGVMLQNIWHFSGMKPAVQQEFKDTKQIYGDVFGAALEDVPVPMPAAVRWVDILKGKNRNAIDSANGGVKLNPKREQLLNIAPDSTPSGLWLIKR